jgi:hypothetical protein
MRAFLTLAAAAMALPVVPAHAQERGAPTYKVEMNIRDEGGAPNNATRHYTLLIESNHKATLKAGSRIPVATASMPNNGGLAAPATQYTYIDVGVNIECTVGEINGRLVMHGNLDFSNVIQHSGGATAVNPPNPTVGQTKLELETSLEPGKPTVIAAFDDPATMRKLQVEATVNRIN